MLRFLFSKKRTKNNGKPRFIIHIGVGKTGTSALQTFFEQNEKNLLKKDICYPTLGRVWTAHHRLSHIIPPLLEKEIPAIPSSVWAEKLAKLPYGNFLISTELMHTITQEQVKAYLAPVMEQFDVYIALYLRRQDEALLSAYNQAVKALSRTFTLSEFIERSVINFDYARKIHNWASVVGDDHILAAIYDKEQFIEGDLRKDFLKRMLGIEDFSGFYFPQEKQVINERLTNDAARIKRVLNHIPMPVTIMRDLETALHTWGKQFAQPHDFWPELSDEEQDALMERFHTSNMNVAKRFFNTESLLFPHRKPSPQVYKTAFPFERVSCFTHFLRKHFPSLAQRLKELYEDIPSEKRTDELCFIMDALAQKGVEKDFPCHGTKAVDIL